MKHVFQASHGIEFFRSFTVQVLNGVMNIHIAEVQQLKLEENWL